MAVFSSLFRSAGSVALSAALAVTIWLAATIHFNYGGNVTGVFCTGTSIAPPKALLGERIYIFKGAPGFDGQFYHYLSHDPFLLSGTLPHLDVPRLRARRILVPMLAFGLALGQHRFIDLACLLVLVLSAALTCYWIARFAVLHGKSSFWGLTGLALPGVIISVDRYATDATLIACCVAAVVYGTIRNFPGAFAVLAAAPLVRETGILLIGSFCLWLLLERDWRRTILMAMSAIPFIGWSIYVGQLTADYSVPLSFDPFASLLEAANASYAFRAPWDSVAYALDALAISAAWLSIPVSLWSIRAGGPPLLRICTLVFCALSMVVLNSVQWGHVYDFGRLLSPLLLFSGLAALIGKQWLPLLPLVAMLPRVVLEIGWQFAGIGAGLL